MSEHGGMPPAGWYPESDGWERFWDGQAWTEDRRAVGSGPGAPPDDPAGGPTQAGPAAPGGPVSPAPAEPTQMAGPGGGPTSPPPGAPPAGYGAVGGGAPYQQGGQPPYGAPGSPGGYGATGGYSPPDAGGFGGPGGPGYPQQQKKSLLWLWVTLAVVLVLVVGTGVTLAVTQPWSDDKSTEAGGDGDGDGEGGDGEGEGGEGTSEGLAASSDFDGDGNGDVAATYYNDRSTALVTLSSDGSAFEVDESPGNTSGLIWDDWNRDGTAAALTWRYSAYNDELEIKDGIGDFDSDTWGGFGLWKDAEYWLRMDSGDFDGDGSVDLALVGQTGDRTVTIWVMRGSGDGFEGPEEWLTVEDATFGSTQIFPGDFDEDGTDDLVALLPTDGASIPKDELDSSLVSTELGATLLTSTGDGFEREDSLGETPFDEDNRMQRYYAVGDFRGDGKPLVAMQAPGYSSQDIVFFEYVDGDFVPAELEADYSGYLQGLTAADVDGDGRDDLVTVRGDSEDSSEMTAMLVETYLSEGEEMGEPAQWAELECEDSCTMAFDNTSGY